MVKTKAISEEGDVDHDLKGSLPGHRSKMLNLLRSTLHQTGYSIRCISIWSILLLKIVHLIIFPGENEWRPSLVLLKGGQYLECG